MNNSARYAFGFLALMLLIAGVVILMREMTGSGEAHYVLPCGLIAIGGVMGLFALGITPDSGDTLSCGLGGESDDAQDASPTED